MVLGRILGLFTLCLGMFEFVMIAKSDRQALVPLILCPLIFLYAIYYTVISDIWLRANDLGDFGS